MDRQQREAIPLHADVLSDADTSEEILINNPEDSTTGSAGDIHGGRPEGIADPTTGNTASSIIGNAGETASPTRLSNDGGVG